MDSNTTVLFAKLAFGKHSGKYVGLPPATDQSSPKTVCAGTTKAPAPAPAAVSRAPNPAGAIADKCPVIAPAVAP
jgi:hypothetical protein